MKNGEKFHFTELLPVFYVQLQRVIPFTFNRIHQFFTSSFQALSACIRPEIIAKAKAEMEEELDGDTYHCPIPDGCKPRALGMKM